MQTLNDRSDGYIFARQLKVKIEKILGIAISGATIAHYQLNILRLKFRRARMQPKIFTDDEKEQRYSISVNLKSWLNADHKNIEKVIDYITIQIPSVLSQSAGSPSVLSQSAGSSIALKAENDQEDEEAFALPKE